MMIKNNIWIILLIVFVFFWAYFSIAYLDAQEADREAIKQEKYEENLIEGKSANLDKVQILAWAEVGNLNIEDSWQTLDWDEEIVEWIEEYALNSEAEIILWSDGEILTSIEGLAPKNIIKQNLLWIFTGEQDEDKQEEEFQVKDRVFPESLNTSMNFHSQSPLWTWGEIFWETCEEASVLLVYLYFKWISVTDLEFRDELLRLVDYQNEVFWDFKHTTVVQTAEILRDYYKYSNYHILENPTADDLKYNIAKGSIILAPFYGIGLNPYYSGIGPEYHFMVLKGYTKDTFITHDVGTRRGENYEYSIETIMDRIHDYHPESVKLWGKRVIIVSPE